MRLSLNGEGSMTTFSRSSINSMGRSAERNALTVIETSSGSVHSGSAVATIYSMGGEPLRIRCQIQFHLINESPAVNIVMDKNLCPELRLATFHKVPSLLLEHRIVVGDTNELIITKALCVSDVGKVRIPGLAELSDNQWLIQL